MGQLVVTVAKTVGTLLLEAGGAYLAGRTAAGREAKARAAAEAEARNQAKAEFAQDIVHGLVSLACSGAAAYAAGSIQNHLDQQACQSQQT